MPPLNKHDATTCNGGRFVYIMNDVQDSHRGLRAAQHDAAIQCMHAAAWRLLNNPTGTAKLTPSSPTCLDAPSTVAAGA